MAVVRRGGEEEAMLEARREVADRAGDARVDRVARARGRRRMVSLVQDEQRAWTDIDGPLPRNDRRLLVGARLQPVAQAAGVGLVDQQSMGDQEPWMGLPRVDAEAPLLAHAADVLAIEDLEDETEPLLHLVLPLQQHRGRRGDHDLPHPPAKEEFACDEARFDRLAETDVVGDEQVDAGQAKRLAKRLELERLDRDARPERCLEE